MGGKTYTWKSWSDAGERAHTVAAEGTDEYTAVFEGPKEEGEGEEEGGKEEQPSGGQSSSPPLTLPVIPSPVIEPTPTVDIDAHPAKKTLSGTARYLFSANQSGASFKCKPTRGATSSVAHR